MEWKNVLGKLAPTVATALGTPLAGVVVAEVCEIFGLNEKTPEAIGKAIESQQMTGEQVSALRQLEMKLKAEEDERGFKYADLEVKDRDSARNREVQTGDKVNRNLAYFIIGAFVSTVICTLAGFTKVDSVLAGTLIGYLSAKAEQILSYYFGSSRSSDRKTELLAKSPPVLK